MGPVASQITDVMDMVNLKVSLVPVASQVTGIINMVNLKVSLVPFASHVTGIINMVNLEVSLGPVASLIIDIIDMVNMYKNCLPLIQINHCIVEVFTIGVVLIRNQKVITNIVANMSLVEMIKKVITDRYGAKAKHFVGFVVKATTLHQYVDMVLILHVIPVT
jgi:hypothetical protein